MKNITYYKKLFIDYPDIVTSKEFAEMIGNVNIKTVQKIIRDNKIQHFTFRNAYYIPKSTVIKYLIDNNHKQRQ